MDLFKLTLKLLLHSFICLSLALGVPLSTIMSFICGLCSFGQLNFGTMMRYLGNKKLLELYSDLY